MLESPKMDRKRIIFLSLSICLFPVFFLTAGCGAVHSTPFTEFTASLQEVRAGADEALRSKETADRDRLIEEIAIASQSAEGFDVVQNLLITNNDSHPFGWEMNKALKFAVSPQFRSGIDTLNSALVSYAQLLTALAGSAIISQAEFDDMARDLNADIKSAFATLQLENSDEIHGIISTGASKAAGAYIHHRRNGGLRKILEENQPLIVELSSRSREAIEIAARDLRTYYDENSMELACELRPDQAAGLEARKENVAKLMALNDDFLTRIRMLETLNNSYRLLPKAHSELILAAETPGRDLVSVHELYENGKQLSAVYKELSDNENACR